MKKLFLTLVICLSIFSPCSAKGYWMAREPIARPDGSYHVSDQLPLGCEGTRVWQSHLGPFYLYFCLTYVMCSDDGDEIVVPIKAHNIAYKGTQYYFDLVKYRYSTRKCSVLVEKTFVSPVYNLAPSVGGWHNVNISAGYDHSIWVDPIEKANKDILNQWLDMRERKLLKRYEFVDD